MSLTKSAIALHPEKAIALTDNEVIIGLCSLAQVTRSAIALTFTGKSRLCPLLEASLS
jgi:hypothetical protein